MSSSKAAKSKRTEIGAADAFLTPGSVVVGEVVEIAADGRVMVTYQGTPIERLGARTIAQDLFLGARVLLAFDGGDPTRPIVLGMVHDRIENRGSLHLKAKRIVLEAQESLLLQCGESGVEARRDGKMILKGKDIVSRASRNNKVQGATVQLN